MIAMVGLLLVQVMYSDFRSLRDMGAGGRDVWMYAFVTIPSFVTFVLPVTLLISLLYVLGQMHRSNEFTAMRAAGVGFLRLTRPIWMIGVVCCGLSWLLNATIVPWSVEQSRTIEENLQIRQQARNLPEDLVAAASAVAFDSPAAGRLWFFNRYSRLTNKAYGATVSILDADRREVSRLVAAQAWRDTVRGGWVFKDGWQLNFDPETGDAAPPERITELHRPDFDEDPELMLLIDRRPSDLSFFELRRLRDYFALSENPKGIAYSVRYFGLIANTLGPLIVIMIAVPFAMSGVRVNPAVGVSKSLVLFFLYYVLANFAASLATKQLLPPDVAAWLPNISMAALGVWLFSRLR